MRHKIASAAAERLRELIAEQYPPGAQLPAEIELAVMLDISRGTLREAMSELVLTGDVIRTWGRGTFVRERERAVTLSLAYIQPIDEVLKAQRRAFRLVHARAELTPLPAAVAPALGLTAGEQVWLCERVFSIDGTPFAYLQDYVPREFGGCQIDMSGFNGDPSASFLATVESQIKVRIDRMEGTVGISVADRRVEAFLQAPDGRPFLQLEQVIQSGGVPLTYGYVYYRPDFVRLSYFRVDPETSAHLSADADLDDITLVTHPRD